MFHRGKTGRALPVLAALACLAGCSANGATPGLRSVGSAVLAPAAPNAQHYGNDWMFATNPGSNQATVYRRKGTQLTYEKTLSTRLSTPQGTFTTPSRFGWWYVTNPGAANVLIYRTSPKGPSGPIGKPLDASGESPINVAVLPNRNLVAVSNLTSGISGAGNVSVYLDRATEPSRTLTYGTQVNTGAGIAIDPHGNCYWSFNTPGTPSSAGSIVEFAQCQGSGTVVVSGLKTAGGLVVDRTGNLYYIDEASGVYKCQGTSNCTLLPAVFGLPVTLNFDSNDKNLWVADATGYLDAVNPQTGEIESQNVSVNGDPFGIAPSPGN